MTPRQEEENRTEAEVWMEKNRKAAEPHVPDSTVEAEKLGEFTDDAVMDALTATVEAMEKAAGMQAAKIEQLEIKLASAPVLDQVPPSPAVAAYYAGAGECESVDKNFWSNVEQLMGLYRSRSHRSKEDKRVMLTYAMGRLQAELTVLH